MIIPSLITFPGIIIHGDQRVYHGIFNYPYALKTHMPTTHTAVIMILWFSIIVYACMHMHA